MTLAKQKEDKLLLKDSTRTFGYKCLMQIYEEEINSCNLKIEFLIRDIKNSLRQKGQSISF